MTSWQSLGPPGLGNDWSDGYVVDVPYTEPISTELNPTWLSMVLVLHGQPPLDRSRSLVWADLGCGSGAQACVVAAANPDIEVWGCDYNPAHVDRAQELAIRSGLPNCSFSEASFERLATDQMVGPSEIDVAVVYGVYSWISEQNQRALVSFLRQRLRPGGIVVVSYELGTGWASMEPLAELMRLMATADGRRSDHAFPDVAAALTELASSGARYFPIGRNEERQLGTLREADPQYAAHEYLGGHFRPLSFEDVSRSMRDARCQYIGGINATDHIRAYWASAGLAELLMSRDPMAQQMIRDLASQRMLRNDIFRRGHRVLTAGEVDAHLDRLLIAGLGIPFRDEPVAVPTGEVALAPEQYEPLVAEVQVGPLGLADLSVIHPDWTRADCVIALSVLAEAGYAAPIATDSCEEAVAATRRLNRILVKEAVRGANHGALASPILSGALFSDFCEMLALDARWNRAPYDSPELLARDAWNLLTAQGRHVIERGARVGDDATALSILKERAARALDRSRSTLPGLSVS
jgi:SAM-dependent methyltransferase